MKRSQPHTDIAIVGMGCAFPQAANVREFWRINANGIDCIEPLPRHRLPQARNWDYPADHDAYLLPHRGGFLPSPLGIDPVRFGIMPKLVSEGDPDQFLMLSVIDQALQDARVRQDDPRRQRTDVIIGKGGYPTYKVFEFGLRIEYIDTILELLERRNPQEFRGQRAELEAYLRSTLPPCEADLLSSGIPNIVASRTANRLDLGGTAHCVDAACASGLLAVEQGLDRLRNGKADLVVAGGFFLTQILVFMHVFNKLGAVSQAGVIRPMDRRADGLLMGEGAGAIILKRLEDAIADQDTIYAIVKGAGSASDGRDVDVLAPSPRGQLLALERAYADAEVDPASIGYLELHGTGTIAGDTAELETVKRFFGRTKRPASARAMGSVKSLIGHCMPASGMAALIRTALALSNKTLPPSLHCEEPRPELLDAPFYVNTLTRPWVHGESRGPRRAGVNSFGFGGVNGHVVLEEALPVATKRRAKSVVPRAIEIGVDRPSELAVFAAQCPTGLVKKIRQVAAFLQEDRGEKTAADVAASLAAQVDRKLPCKLAVVFTTLEELAEKLAALPNAIELGQMGSGPGQAADRLLGDEAIYFSPAAEQPPGEIAFIFPGMGFPGLIGNYPDHVLELCLHHPELRAEFDYFEERDRHPDDDVPTSSVFVPPASLPEEYRQRLKSRLAPPKTDAECMVEQLPEERYLAAMGVTLVNWISWTLLEQFHIPVSMMTGQSQGEMAAVCAAGMTDFHATAPAYWKVLNINPRYGAGGRLGFCWAPAETVEPLLKQHPGTHIAIYMSPQAVIIGGERDGVIRVLDTLKEQQIFTQLLPYPPIHTPVLSYLQDELHEALDSHEFRVKLTNVRMYSSITTKLYPKTEAGIRKTLMMNLDHPLRIWETMRRMYDDGARVFVQVGGGHMSAHMREFLPEEASVVTAALDVDTRNPLTQLNHLLATLFTAGVSIDFAPLYARRIVQTFDPTQPRPEPPKPKMFVPLRIEWSPLFSPNVPPKSEDATGDESVAPGAPVTEPAAPVEMATPTAAEPVQVVVPTEESREVTATAVEEPDLNPPVVTFDVPLPVLGNVTQFDPERSLVIERMVDIEADWYLYDHLFVRADHKPLQYQLPVVPMTMSLEFVAEAAALLCPGLGLIGYEDVRALRWIGLEDVARRKLTISAQLVAIDDDGTRKIDVALDLPDKRALTARVLFGSAYRQTLEWPELTDPPTAPWPCSPDAAYGERLMFHGPRFQVISQLGGFGDPICTGTMRVPPKDQLFRGVPQPQLLIDPCLVDGVGQMVGMWCLMYDLIVLPTGVDQIEIYGPPPPVGTELEVRVHITKVDHEVKQVRANIELGDGQGGVWMRFRNWGDWLFNSPLAYESFKRFPESRTFSALVELPGLSTDLVVTALDDPSLVGTDMMAGPRMYLTLEEQPGFDNQPNNKSKRRWLGPRIVAKDAARTWRRQLTGELLHPSSFTYGHDALGRPEVTDLPPGPVPWISVAHKDRQYVAVASAAPIGIDLEPATHDTEALLEHFATADEIERLAPWSEADPGFRWATRLWCAKEAAGKARGTGLEGRPKRLQLIDLQPDGVMTLLDSDASTIYVVATFAQDGWIWALGWPATDATDRAGVTDVHGAEAAN